MMEKKEITYSQEEVNAIAKGYSSKLQFEIQSSINKDLAILKLNQKISELTKQNNDLRKENTELKTKVNIRTDEKEYNGKPEIHNIP